MNESETRKKLDELHSKLLKDILYTELVNEGRGFVEHNIYIIKKESGDQWDEEIAERRVKLLQDTALIPPKAVED